MNKILLIFCLIFNFCYSQKKEYFFDSKSISKTNKYKIKISQKNSRNESIVNYELFKKLANKWTKIQKGNFKKQTDIGLFVTVDEDLNNDGYNDLKISYAQAARGANEIEKLFIFNPLTQRLVEIINSQNYPNLHYNKKRNCINSYTFYSGNSTYFLNIKENRLENFARVDFYNDSVYSYKIKNGKETLLEKREYKSNDEGIFFSNFEPIEE